MTLILSGKGPFGGLFRPKIEDTQVPGVHSCRYIERVDLD